MAQAPAIGFPVCIAFPPDGSNRIFFSEKNNGRVRIIRHDTLVTTPFVTVSVTSNGEQGLLGLTFHPAYPDSPYVYVYYTRSGDRANIVVRYTDQNGVGINPTALMVMPRLNAATNHNGGNIHFGPDGKLYVTVGENATSSNSQDTLNSNKLGKIHRINADGTTPSDNPFTGNTIYVYGCRNSFDFTFDQLNGKMYASENGPSCNDEVNLIVAGANYGWPNDGNCSYSGNAQYKRPLYYWPSNLPAVTGITIYRGNAFPSLNGKLLVSCYNQSSVFQFTLNATGDSITSGPTTFLNYGSALDDVDVGPDGYIYIANGSYDGTSHLLRLRPIISAPPTPLLNSSLHGAVNQARRPTLSWHKSTDATTYHLQISTDSLFSNFVFNDSTLTDTTKLLPPLSYYTTYYWRVRAINSEGTSSYSTIWNFKTAGIDTTTSILMNKGWNLISLPVYIPHHTRQDLYPGAISNMFEYIHNTGYVTRDTLFNGKGYWLKYPDSTNLTVHITGGVVTTDTIDVVQGWNLIGSLSDTVQGTSIQSIPADIILTSFYGYNNGYSSAPHVIAPGKGYWVKVSSDGKIVLRH